MKIKGKSIKKFILDLKSQKVAILFTVAAILLLVEVIGFYGKEFKHAILSLYENPASVKTITLFYGEGCPQCDKVNTFLEKNKVESKMSFTKLEVFHNPLNVSIMEDRSQTCGLDPEQIGVPFLWDGAHCFVGYVDVIKFFDEKLKSLK